MYYSSEVIMVWCRTYIYASDDCCQKSWKTKHLFRSQVSMVNNKSEEEATEEFAGVLHPDGSDDAILK